MHPPHASMFTACPSVFVTRVEWGDAGHAEGLTPCNCDYPTPATSPQLTRSRACLSQRSAESKIAPTSRVTSVGIIHQVALLQLQGCRRVVPSGVDAVANS